MLFRSDPAQRDLPPYPGGRFGENISKLKNNTVPRRYNRYSVHADLPICCRLSNTHIGLSASFLSLLHFQILAKVHLQMKQGNDIVRRLPLISLIAANAIPVFGVLFAGWDAFNIVLLYWAENIAVGFYNILKMAFVKMKDPKELMGKLFAISFFVLHFGGFTGIHGVFVLTMFHKSGGEFMHGTDWPCFLIFVQILLNVMGQAYSLLSFQMKLALLPQLPQFWEREIFFVGFGV